MRDSLVIILECLLTHHVFELRHSTTRQELTMVPGVMKLYNLKGNEPKHPFVTHFIADRRSGILVRQLLLSIHGRHKGPFREMELFGSDEDYYNNHHTWSQVASLFNQLPDWKALEDFLMSFMKTFLYQRHNKTSPLKVKIDEGYLSEHSQQLYGRCLEPNSFRRTQIISFWEQQLGLTKDNAASNLYRALQASAGSNIQFDVRDVINTSLQQWNGCERDKVQAIIAIEPLRRGRDLLH